MSTGPIPAEWGHPIATPTVVYWRGIDHLEAQWERTRSLDTSGRDIGALQEYLFWRMNLIVWACCAIESYVNEEGVAWLGEDFFKENLERLGICEKIAVLYALKYRKRLEQSDENLRETRGLFGLRNRLVHPKTKQVKKGDKKDDLRAVLDAVSPQSLRQNFWRVTRLFEPEGVGEEGKGAETGR